MKPRRWSESDVVSLDWRAQLVVDNAVSVFIAIKHLNIASTKTPGKFYAELINIQLRCKQCIRSNENAR